jgi:hypothetical protein
LKASDSPQIVSKTLLSPVLVMLQGDTIKQPIVSSCNISLEKLDSIELSCRCTSSQPLVYLESTYERSEAAYDVEELAAADVVDGAI